MATWHQSRNAAGLAALYRPKVGVWRVVDNRPNEMASAIEFSSEAKARRLAKRNGGFLIAPPQSLPCLIRRFYHQDVKRWEVFAVFPTVPAESSNWHAMQAYSANGEHFACSPEYYRASRHCRGWRSEEVKAFEAQARQAWENDSDFPCVLDIRERLSPAMNERRRDQWKAGRT